MNNEKSFASDVALRESSSGSSEQSPGMADKFEPIDVEGQEETGIWVHRPGTDAGQVWEPRKGKNRHTDSQIQGELDTSIGRFKSLVPGSYPSDSSSTDESQEGSKDHSRHRVRRGLQKIRTVFHRSTGKEDKPSSTEVPVLSLDDKIMAVSAEGSGVKFMVEDNPSAPASTLTTEGRDNREGSGPESPSKGHINNMAKSIMKHAGNSARGLKNALSPKGPKKSKGEPGSVLAGRDISIGSDSSDKDSLSSPVGNPEVESNSVISTPISVYDSDSSKSKEHTVQESLNDPAVNVSVDKVSVEGFEGISDRSPVSSEGNGDGLIQEHLSSKPSEGNLGVDK